MLPGMRPALTRAGFSSGGRFRADTYAKNPEDYPRVEETDLWLPPAFLADEDRQAGVDKLTAIAEAQKAHEMLGYAERSVRGARILGRTAVTETGCMVDGLRGNQDPFEVAIKFGELELGSFAFTTPDEMPHIQTCGTPGCYNSRHFDMDFGRPTLQQREIELNPNFYQTLPSGEIRTLWGDILPSVEDSMAYLIQLQRQNFPFVPSQAGKLTPTGISQIGFHPVTGCWESWQYYIQSKSWQKDGYGRLYQKKVTEVNKETGEITVVANAEQKVAHRVTWRAVGNKFVDGEVLNHLCSYRRCCNPLHIQQVTKTANSIHGARTQRAINALYESNPETEDARMSVVERMQHGPAMRKLYAFIWSEIEKDAS